MPFKDATHGRLALLFADGHVRLLELRLEKLLMEEQLYRGLSGLIDAPDDSEDGDVFARQAVGAASDVDSVELPSYWFLVHNWTDLPH